jgi:hypothetical protein
MSVDGASLCAAQLRLSSFIAYYFASTPSITNHNDRQYLTTFNCK